MNAEIIARWLKELQMEFVKRMMAIEYEVANALEEAEEVNTEEDSESQGEFAKSVQWSGDLLSQTDCSGYSCSRVA